ncbi:MAG: iron-containing alcohol dehydrogenase [Patulibacter sp.]|nr:iron-containing alcohol dehydrogenase [Patulibacter sp.]
MAEPSLAGLPGTPVVVGPGGVEALGVEVVARGFATVLLVTDRDVADAGVPERVMAALDASGVAHRLVLAPPGEPTDEGLEGLVTELGPAATVDGVIAVGGGSVLDYGKLVSLRLAGGIVTDHLNRPYGLGRPVAVPPVPVVAVPTTAGSGSEVSPVAVIEMRQLGVKSALSSPRLRPVLAVADPTTTLSLPRRPTAAAAVDVLAHAVESLTARPRGGRADAAAVPAPGGYVGANPYSDALCRAGLELLASGLGGALADGRSLGDRDELMRASVLVSLGASVAGPHVGHAVGYALAGTAACARVPHGFTVGAVLPAIARRLAPSHPAALATISAALGADPAVAAHDVAQPASRLTAFLRVAGAPASLRELGIVAGDLPELARAAVGQQRLMAGSDLDEGGVLALLEDAL